MRGPEEHGTRLRNNALNLLGNAGLAPGSAAPAASIAPTLATVIIGVLAVSGWTSGSLVSLYVMLGIGAVIMIWVRAARTSAYFATPREAFQPEVTPPRRSAAHRR